MSVPQEHKVGHANCGLWARARTRLIWLIADDSPGVRALTMDLKLPLNVAAMTLLPPRSSRPLTVPALFLRPTTWAEIDRPTSHDKSSMINYIKLPMTAENC